MALLLTGAGVATYKAFQADYVVDISAEPPPTTLAPATTVLPSTTSTTTPATTTTTAQPDTPVQEADTPEEKPWFTEAGTVSIAAPDAGIDYPVDTFGWDGTNACGSQKSPCFERANNFVDPDIGLVSACQQGVSLFAGHSVWSGGPDSFSNIYDDKEFDWDDGLKAGNEVIATLDDGSTCHGVVRDFDEGPGEPVPQEVMHDTSDAAVRFWPKPELGRGITRELVEMYGEDSYGVLMASFCNECRFPDGFYIADDGKWHRYYNVAVLVEWTHVQTADHTPEEAR